MQPLVKAAVDCVTDGRTQFVPERFTKNYTGWMENIHDWCISRQIWWGHRIPVWYCDDCGEMSASRTDLEKCPKCGSTHIHQDEDALDTWFSSALWPFSTMGWPDNTELLKQFYPTSVLVTGYDIIFFWVARMLIMGMEFMKEIPFEKVFIHGLVRDSQGRKMSKSLGNGIDPLEVIEKYGADTLRFMLITGNTPGNDMRFYWERVEGTRNFANKIWNASRFALMNMEATTRTQNLRLIRWPINGFFRVCRILLKTLPACWNALSLAKQDAPFTILSGAKFATGTLKLPNRAFTTKKLRLNAQPRSMYWQPCWYLHEAFASVHAVYYRGNLPVPAARSGKHYDFQMACG